jgi:hypothetical protein
MTKLIHVLLTALRFGGVGVGTRYLCTAVGGVCMLSIALALQPFPRVRAEQPPKDFKDLKLDELGVRLVAPRKDPRTGFVVGGTNATSLIKGLTEINGIPIANLEKAMRPGALSQAGFLGKGEGLLEVMAADNRYVVEELGLTHQELAKHLHVLGAIGRRHFPQEAAFTYHGSTFKVKVVSSHGYQDSPFKDGTRTNSDATVQNVGNGKKLGFSLLVPFMIERYGFYEGKGTTYRVDPHQVVQVLDILKAKKR